VRIFSLPLPILGVNYSHRSPVALNIPFLLRASPIREYPRGDLRFCTLLLNFYPLMGWPLFKRGNMGGITGGSILMARGTVFEGLRITP